MLQGGLASGSVAGKKVGVERVEMAGVAGVVLVLPAASGAAPMLPHMPEKFEFDSWHFLS